MVPVAADRRLVFADPCVYCAHADMVRDTAGRLLVVFNRAPRRRAILHPPQDPYFENVLVRSEDEGATWSAPSVVPDYGWQGAECAGLTATRAGTILLHQFRFRWYPLGIARRRALVEPVDFPAAWVGELDKSLELDSGQAFASDPERLVPWARGPGRSWVHLSADGGETFAATVELDTAPFAGGYNMRGAAELVDGTLVLPLCDAPAYQRVYVLRSGDGGRSWGPAIPAAALAGRLFEEPAPLALPSGRILLALRENVARTLYVCWSDDAGLTWSEPRPTGIDGYPAHLLRLADGRLLCTYGYREPPFAIRAVISEDGGATWDTAAPLAIVEGLPNKNLGYPATVTLASGDLLTVYYAEDGSGVTGIWTARWSLP
jgi:hypothetical protein